MFSTLSRRFRAASAVCATALCFQAMVGCAIDPVSANPANAEPPTTSNCPATAAASHNWGAPNRIDDFTTGSLDGWHVYDGPGHLGYGRRTPAAVTVAGGLLTITGDAAGNSGGMGWDAGQKYGRWEVCAKSTPAAATYHSVALLWPDAGGWPLGGEIDFMEILDPARQNVEGWLHFGADDQRTGGSVQIDATQWHSWAVEWTPDRVTAYVDGNAWLETRDARQFPPGSMHLCLQLDNFGGDTSQGGQQVVDWVRQYPLT